MCGLAELTTMSLHRPGPDATPAEVAAYRLRLAAIHDELADESAAAHEAELERAHAARLRAAAAA